MKGKINYTSVNIRKKPDGEIIGIIAGGEIVTIKEKEGGWYKTTKGYIRADLIDVIKEKKKDAKL